MLYKQEGSSSVFANNKLVTFSQIEWLSGPVHDKHNTMMLNFHVKSAWALVELKVLFMIWKMGASCAAVTSN